MNTQFYKELAKQIKHDYAKVNTLPGERIMAERYACTRSTIRAALNELTRIGALKTIPQRGHRLTPAAAAVPQTGPKTWNVVMFTVGRSLEDPQFLDFIAGAIHHAKICGINLVIREVDENTDANTAAALEQFHQGIEADGYLLARCISERFLGFLENQFKPCIVLGEVLFAPPEKRRYFQVCLPQGEKYRFVINKLLRLGHRKFLTMSKGNDAIGQLAEQCFHENGITDASIETIVVEFPTDPTVMCFSTVRKVVAAVKDHTALLIPIGGATALSIYRHLLDSGIKIPEQLSLVINSGRYDYFVNVCRIDSVFSSAWEEGVACIAELERQLRTGDLRFGSKISHYQYIAGETVAPPAMRVRTNTDQ